MNISFSPPDITDIEIAEVVDTLKSGWITTGPKTKLFEQKISEYCETNKTVCLNSATAGMELILRLFDIGEGDEVITSAYTYTASASVIHHTGAKIVLIDTEPNSYFMDLGKLENAITPKTKAIIAVDIAGVMCDYDMIFGIVNRKSNLFSANGEFQSTLGRILVLSDAAHSFGAEYKDKKSGNIADFTSFSFHAVKNITTGEGGAVTWLPLKNISDEEIYKRFMLFSLHGQSKDALAKTDLGAWEYDIIEPLYKCNMTDIAASMGLGQLSRYENILKRRFEIINRYNEGLKYLDLEILDHTNSSGHLYLTRLNGKDELFRNNFIKKMAQAGIATNVHYKPLPMHTAYKNLGFDIKDFGNAFNQYQNEVTLPLHTLLNNEETNYIIDNFIDILKG